MLHCQNIYKMTANEFKFPCVFFLKHINNICQEASVWTQKRAHLSSQVILEERKLQIWIIDRLRLICHKSIKNLLLIAVKKKKSSYF